jgi:hypothetical protein
MNILIIRAFVKLSEVPGTKWLAPALWDGQRREE